MKLKSKFILALFLALASSAFASDPRVLGEWDRACVALPTGGSFVSYAVFYENDTAVQTQKSFASDDCSGEAATVSGAATYTITGSPTDSVVSMNLTTDPADRRDGVLVWGIYEITFLKPGELTARFTQAVVMMNGAPIQLPASEIEKLPVELWKRR